MAFLRRLALSAAVALAVSASPVLSAGSGSGSATVATQCATSMTAADAPVRKPLASVVGDTLVDTVFNFITETPLGKLLAGEDARTCIANMDGAKLGTTLLDRLKTSTCAPFYNVTDVPFVKKGLDMVTANNASFPDVLKLLKATPNSEIDQFCGMYTASIVPCVVSELLPTLSLIRASYSGGCCDAWSDEVLADYGYTISGQLTKVMQLFGDAMCAKQTPGFDGTGSQRCGFTALQTLLTKADTASFAAMVLRNLQVPSSQMCLRAEGKAYTDINGNSVDASEPTPSGCVVTIDRVASWMYSLPFTAKSELFDVKALLEDDKCLNGSELFPTVTYLLPALALDEVAVYFSKSCVHLPMKFADKCTYARPALLVEWDNEPSPVETDSSATKTASTSKTPASTPAATTTTPAAATSSGLRPTGSTRGLSLLLLTTAVAWAAAL